MYLILSIVTGIYLILSSVRDLKERMIYSFPAIVLTLAWGKYYFVRFGFVQCHFSYLQQAIFWH